MRVTNTDFYIISNNPMLSQTTLKNLIVSSTKSTSTIGTNTAKALLKLIEEDKKVDQHSFTKTLNKYFEKYNIEKDKVNQLKIEIQQLKKENDRLRMEKK